MSTDVSKFAVPLWRYRVPPSGLSVEWELNYRVLVNPVTQILTFRGMAHAARHGSSELYQSWFDALLNSEAAVSAVLQSLRGRSPRTWRMGQAILSAISPISAALCSTAQFLSHPPLTANGTEATSEVLREDIVEKLNGFDAVPLMDELAAAVVNDCEVQRGRQTIESGTTTTTTTAQPLPPSRTADAAVQAPQTVENNNLRSEIDQESLALGLLFQHLDWSIADIAKHLNVNRKTLYKWDRFRDAAERLDRLKPRGPKARKLREGHKTRDGRVEAQQDERKDE